MNIIEIKDLNRYFGEGEKVIVSQVANGEQVGSMPRGPRMF